MNIIVLKGKAEIRLNNFKENFVDSIVTDPPWGIKFMGKKWDYNVPSVKQWKIILQTLKPGGYALVNCGTRTQHRMAVNLEDAGFEIRDIIAWIYGSGFPKNLDISKQNFSQAHQWSGWGTALKPAMELWTLCRKPLSEKTIAGNILKHGTGGINIDGCRIEFKSQKDYDSAKFGRGTDIMGGNYVGAIHSSGRTNIEANPAGRFPANIILDEEAGIMLDTQAPQTGAYAPVKSTEKGHGKGIYSYFNSNGDNGKTFYDGILSGASRFFYCAKASPKERNFGLEGFILKPPVNGKNFSSSGKGSISSSKNYQQNTHPTVKPIALMRYLCRLITPTGGIVLDPFAGSGTTGIACLFEGFNAVLIEKEIENCLIARARIDAWTKWINEHK
jgi:site-specific DNA-methyltransferase (adenine-specific)